MVKIEIGCDAGGNKASGVDDADGVEDDDRNDSSNPEG